MKLLYFSGDHCKACEPMYKYFEGHEGDKMLISDDDTMCDWCSCHEDGEQGCECCNECDEYGLSPFIKYKITQLPTFILLDEELNEVRRGSVMNPSQWEKFINV